MILSNKTLTALLLGAMVTTTIAQIPRRRGATRRPTPTATPRPEPTPSPESPPRSVRPLRAPAPLAIVNGQTITTADLDPKVADAFNSLEERIAETRLRILNLQINTLLLDTEARKRKLSSQQLYDMEVTRRISAPTEAEIQKVLQENRDQIDVDDPATIRKEVIEFIKANREARLSDDLIKRMRAAVPVIMGANFQSANLAPATVLATVAGRAITEAMIAERLKPVAYKLKLETYEVVINALDHTINDLLLLAEANRRNIPPEDIVRTEVSDKIRSPSEAEISKFYSDNKARITGDLNSVRTQLASYLQDQDQRRLEKELSERLRKGANVRLMIAEPEPPVQAVSTDDDPTRGDVNAPVTIVEFTDYQCPACAAMHPVLEEVLQAYGNKVRLVVRDFPLSMHANARKAAEAANAAHAQGKYFEYAALLFKRQNALDVPSLKKYASELGLDRARFDAALDSGTYAAEVRHDMDDGEMYGLESTPTIFINGVMLTTLSAEALRAAIDKALAKATAAPR